MGALTYKHGGLASSRKVLRERHMAYKACSTFLNVLHLLHAIFFGFLILIWYVRYSSKCHKSVCVLQVWGLVRVRHVGYSFQIPILVI